MEEGTTFQIITIALDIKGNSILEARRSTPFFVLQIGFQLTCLGSSSDVRIPGELQVYILYDRKGSIKCSLIISFMLVSTFQTDYIYVYYLLSLWYRQLVSNWINNSEYIYLSKTLNLQFSPEYSSPCRLTILSCRCR